MVTHLLHVTFIIAFLGEKYTYVESHHVQRRIVLGNDIDIRYVPWEVSLHEKWRPDWQTFVCGGSIIGPNEVLTAGHCIGNASHPNYFIRAGNTNKYIGGSVHDVEGVEIYPGFKATSCKIQHDLAFIRVKQPFEFSEYIQPIKLAKKEPLNGEYVLIAGWGKLNPYHGKEASYSDTLKYTQISAWHKNACYKNFAMSDILIYEKDMLCLSNANKGTLESICDGDSGSPVVVNNRLVGVVSAYLSSQIELPPDRLCGPLTEEEKKQILCSDYNTVGAFNSIVPHRDWIYKLLIKSRKKKGYFCFEGCF